jgi:hypothetical protein
VSPTIGKFYHHLFIIIAKISPIFYFLIVLFPIGHLGGEPERNYANSAFLEQ